MKKILVFIPLFMLSFIIGCNQTTSEATRTTEKDLVSDVFGQEDQQTMTPQAILEDLMAGNKRYQENKLISRDLPAQVKATANGQYPKAIILSCVDSRVPVELIFDQGIGDVFVARVAGNAENEDLLGSIEYAVGVAGSKVVMVLGHESCGAIKSAIDKLDVGSKNVTHLLKQIESAIKETEGERNSKNKEYLTEVVQSNVDVTVQDIRSRSQIVKQLESEGKVMVVGAYYSLQDGKVTLLDKK